MGKKKEEKHYFVGGDGDEGGKGADVIDVVNTAKERDRERERGGGEGGEISQRV